MLAEALENGLIDLEPEYQREVVWTGKEDPRLVVTLL